MLLFVFFKPKTAYGLRISDWSSDLCSSDLLFEAATRKPDEDGNGGGHRASLVDDVLMAVVEMVHTSGEPITRDMVHARLDRKSVVLGKSVSVRVDLGGRSIITKQKAPRDTHRVQ